MPAPPRWASARAAGRTAGPAARAGLCRTSALPGSNAFEKAREQSWRGLYHPSITSNPSGDLLMNRLALRLTVFTAVIAANAAAALSPQYRDWGNSAVQYLMMKQEKLDWSALRTDADAKAFIDLFWARRDPTPDTPANELRQQFEARIAEADKRFTFGKTPGSQTDHGLVYVLFGEPSQIAHGLTKRGPVVGMNQFQRPINVETWIYRGEAAERVAGTQSFDPMFAFHD